MTPSSSTPPLVSQRKNAWSLAFFRPHLLLESSLRRCFLIFPPAPHRLHDLLPLRHLSRRYLIFIYAFASQCIFTTSTPSHTPLGSRTKIARSVVHVTSSSASGKQISRLLSSPFPFLINVSSPPQSSSSATTSSGFAFRLNIPPSHDDQLPPR